MTTPTAATPAAPVAATPAAPIPAAAAPAAASTSLIPAEPAAPVAAAPAAAAPVAAAPVAPTAAVPGAPAAANPNNPNAWVLSEGVLGTGDRPAWFKNDKYASVAAQAEAYPALEKRFGSFVGAPADGKYDTKLPADAGVELVADHPLLTEFTKWGAENQLSQTGFTKLMGMLGQYEAQQVVDIGAVKTELGANADARITAVAQWGKANLEPGMYETLRAAVSGKEAAQVFQVLEAAIAKSKQITLPGPGSDVPTGGVDGHAALDKRMREEKDSKGGLRWNTDAKFRAEIEAARVKLFQSAT